MNSMVLKRYDGSFARMNFSSPYEKAYFYHWISKKSVKDLDKLTEETQRIYKYTRQPTLISFFDFKDPKFQEGSRELKSLILNVTNKFKNHINLAYIND